MSASPRSGAEPQAFRDVMRSLATGVSLVTAFDRDGRPHGVTVTSFCSVSLFPPLMLISLDSGSATFRAVAVSRGFTINLLAPADAPLAEAFATGGADEFTGLDWVPPSLPEAGPVFPGRGRLECRVDRTIPLGDRASVVGLVLRGGEPDEPAAMVYCRQSYGIWNPSDPPGAGTPSG